MTSSRISLPRTSPRTSRGLPRRGSDGHPDNHEYEECEDGPATTMVTGPSFLAGITVGAVLLLVTVEQRLVHLLVASDVDGLVFV